MFGNHGNYCLILLILVITNCVRKIEPNTSKNKLKDNMDKNFFEKVDTTNCLRKIEPNTSKNKLKYHMDKNFFKKVDTTNWQYIYDKNKKANFNTIYYVGIFTKSTRSCLYCIVNTVNNIITPLPIWSCDIKFKHDSNFIIIKNDSAELLYIWRESTCKFYLVP
jgi:hypothetical protein